MTEAEIQEIRSELARPAGRDYDARCENGSCHKASALAGRTEELLDEVVRLRAWLNVISSGHPSGLTRTAGAWARQALAGDEVPA